MNENKKEFVEVDEKRCEEVNNCMGVRTANGKRYCRGCGNVQPEGVPIGYADQSGLAPATQDFVNGGKESIWELI